MPSYTESCVISEDRDSPADSMSKTINIVPWERVAMNGIDSMSGDVVVLALV